MKQMKQIKQNTQKCIYNNLKAFMPPPQKKSQQPLQHQVLYASVHCKVDKLLDINSAVTLMLEEVKTEDTKAMPL